MKGKNFCMYLTNCLPTAKVRAPTASMASSCTDCIPWALQEFTQFSSLGDATIMTNKASNNNCTERDVLHSYGPEWNVPPPWESTWCMSMCAAEPLPLNHLHALYDHCYFDTGIRGLFVLMSKMILIYLSPQNLKFKTQGQLILQKFYETHAMFRIRSSISMIWSAYDTTIIFWPSVSDNRCITTDKHPMRHDNTMNNVFLKDTCRFSSNQH